MLLKIGEISVGFHSPVDSNRSGDRYLPLQDAQNKLSGGRGRKITSDRLLLNLETFAH